MCSTLVKLATEVHIEFYIVTAGGKPFATHRSKHQPTHSIIHRLEDSPRDDSRPPARLSRSHRQQSLQNSSTTVKTLSPTPSPVFSYHQHIIITSSLAASHTSRLSRTTTPPPPPHMPQENHRPRKLSFLHLNLRLRGHRQPHEYKLHPPQLQPSPMQRSTATLHQERPLKTVCTQYPYIRTHGLNL